MIKGKGFDVPNGYMGYVKGGYMLFPSENEYWEYLLEESEV